MSTKQSRHDARLVGPLCDDFASVLGNGLRVYLSETRRTYRSDAKFYCGKRVALAVTGRAVVLSTDWHEGEEDFHDFSTWNVAVVERWRPDGSWSRESALEIGPVTDIRVVDEVVEGALAGGPVVFTRALLLQGDGKVLCIAADVEETSGMDLSVSALAAREYLELAYDVRLARAK